VSDTFHRNYSAMGRISSAITALGLQNALGRAQLGDREPRFLNFARVSRTMLFVTAPSEGRLLRGLPRTPRTAFFDLASTGPQAVCRCNLAHPRAEKKESPTPISRRENGKFLCHGFLATSAGAPKLQRHTACGQSMLDAKNAVRGVRGSPRSKRPSEGAVTKSIVLDYSCELRSEVLRHQAALVQRVLKSECCDRDEILPMQSSCGGCVGHAARAAWI